MATTGAEVRGPCVKRKMTVERLTSSTLDWVAANRARIYGVGSARSRVVASHILGLGDKTVKRYADEYQRQQRGSDIGTTEPKLQPWESTSRIMLQYPELIIDARRQRDHVF